MSLWTRLALSIALGAGLHSMAFAMGTEPPADTNAKPVECKEADKTKCPPVVKPADAGKPAALPGAKDCKQADKTKCPAKQGFLDRYHDAVALIDAHHYEDALVAMQSLDD